MEALIKLDSTHREQLAAHLLALDRDDRANRFLSTVSDDYVQRYVDGIGYAGDVLIGALQGRRLVALAHAAVYLESGELVSEAGVSVDKDLRRNGLGKRLLHAAIAAAKRFKVRRVHVIFRSDNMAMTALTRAMGARINCQGAESSAVFEINGGPHLPLRTTRDFQGAEALHATHPRERGRALLVHAAGGDSYQWLPSRLEAHRVKRSVLLASIPPDVPRSDDLHHAMAEVHCSISRVVAHLALTDAPVSAVCGTPLLVFGGTRDCVVPRQWVRDTARRYGVMPRLVHGGHRLMLGRAADSVMKGLAA